jgi:hypothetical protein
MTLGRDSQAVGSRRGITAQPGSHVRIDRCPGSPECLRLLARPARIGRISETFLEWCGTEFMCVKGHGLLHVPDIQTVSFRTQRWMHLGRSWSGLFL